MNPKAIVLHIKDRQITFHYRAKTKEMSAVGYKTKEKNRYNIDQIAKQKLTQIT